MKRAGTLIGWWAAFFAAGWLAVAVAAEESGSADAIDSGLPDTGGEKTCVLLRSIDRTDVIDDYNILFYMRGREIYHVRLPNRCSGLRIADSFMYSTSLNVLCDLDIIRPLRNYGGSFNTGAACGMGRFTPITKEEIVLLKEKDIDVEAERGDADVETLVAEKADAADDDAGKQE